MRLPSLPGPTDVLAAVDRLRDGMTEALALVPRVAATVGRLEGLLDGATGALTRIEGLLDRADAAVVAVVATQARADLAVDAVRASQERADRTIEAVRETQTRAAEIVDWAGATTARAEDTVVLTERLVGRLGPLIGAYEQPLQDLAPSVRRLAETLEPHEVEALVTLIDRLPVLVEHLDEDILPVLRSMGDVGTDIHDLLDTVQDLRQVVKGFPGSRLFRRRGAEEIAQEEAEERDQADDDQLG